MRFSFSGQAQGGQVIVVIAIGVGSLIKPYVPVEPQGAHVQSGMPGSGIAINYMAELPIEGLGIELLRQGLAGMKSVFRGAQSKRS